MIQCGLSVKENEYGHGFYVNRPGVLRGTDRVKLGLAKEKISQAEEDEMRHFLDDKIRQEENRRKLKELIENKLNVNHVQKMHDLREIMAE